MPNYSVTVDEIDQLLPQTQCGECGYKGCQPYAKAMVNHGEAINRCPPGGIDTLVKLAEKLDRDPAPYLEEMQAKQKSPQLAFIREDECIGCTKCIQACPVDAIIGTNKMMHTVLASECTGCGLCVPACPVDCIDMKSVERLSYQPELARKRYMAKNKRLALKKQNQQLSAMREANLNQQDVISKKDLIKAAIARAKNKNPVKF